MEFFMEKIALVGSYGADVRPMLEMRLKGAMEVETVANETNSTGSPTSSM